MNRKIWSGLTTASIATALTMTSSSYAEGSKAFEQTAQTHHATTYALPSPVEGNDPLGRLKAEEYRSEIHNQTDTHQDESHSAGSPVSPPQANVPDESAVKVGEYNSENQSNSDADAIAKIEPHQVGGRSAATLFVRNIPVLTFLGSTPSSNNDTKIGTEGDSKNLVTRNQAGGTSDLHTNLTDRNFSEQSEDSVAVSDPVWKATTVAASLNQLNREAIDANSIAVVWNSRSEGTTSNSTRSDRESYIIQVNGQKLVEVDANTRLPDTTNNLAQDALQITNRLRRLMGDAPPLRDIAGRPAPAAKPIRIALTTRPILSRITGVASWYGPGFHGNRSANGEIFNQNAFTAAHRTLAFGTQVRVTNLNNGLSVIVRINDRGPYSGGRVIDLSAAAARTVGMMQTGVAPVSLEILGRSQTVALDQN